MEQWQLDEVERGEIISKKIEEKSKKLNVATTSRKKLFSSRKLYHEVLDENPQLKPTFPPYFNEWILELKVSDDLSRRIEFGPLCSE